MFKGVSVDPANPFKFEILIDQGDTEFNNTALQNEASKLFKYFLAALTTSEKDIWVNLSPFEKDRIIPKDFGHTLMGRDMLAQDYVLKQLTSSIMFSDDDLSQEFWDTVYERMYELYGKVDLDVNSFNKVWIVPEKAVVYEDGLKALVIKSHLKVLLQEDYTTLMNQDDEALKQNKIPTKIEFNDNLGIASDQEQMHKEASKILKEIIVPAIEKEVNEGLTFSKLRQIYNALILASWYKQRLRDSLLAKIYTNQNKTIGIDTSDKEIVEKIYNQYVDGFNKGVYNFIREDYDPINQEIIPRKYASGGVGLFNPTKESLKNGVKKFGAYLSGILVVLTAATFSTSTDVQAETLNKFIKSDLYKVEIALTEVGPNFSQSEISSSSSSPDLNNEKIGLWVKNQLGAKKLISMREEERIPGFSLSRSTEKALSLYTEQTQNNQTLLADNFQVTLSGHDLLQVDQPLSYHFQLAQNNFFSNPPLSTQFGRSQDTLFYNNFPAWLQSNALTNVQLYEIESNPNLIMSSTDGFNPISISGTINRDESIQDANSHYLTFLQKKDLINFSLYSWNPDISKYNFKKTDVDQYMNYLNTITETSSFTWNDLNNQALANAYENTNAKKANEEILASLTKERYSTIIGNYTPTVDANFTPIGMVFTAGAKIRDSNDYYAASINFGATDILGLNLRADLINWNDFHLSVEGNAWLQKGETGYRLGSTLKSKLIENANIVFGGSYQSAGYYIDNSQNGGFYVYGGIEFTFGRDKHNKIQRNIDLPTAAKKILFDSKLKIEGNNNDDGAMTVNPRDGASLSTDFTKGGIDFNPTLLDLQIRRDSNWTPLPLSQQPIETIQIQGLIPVVIHVTPINGLPEFMGIPVGKPY